MPIDKKEMSTDREDRMIREVMESDHSTPSAPKDEWQKISSHLHEKTSKSEVREWFWKSGPILIATMAILLIVVLPKQHNISLSNKELEEIARYLIDTNLPHEEEQMNLVSFDSL